MPLARTFLGIDDDLVNDEASGGRAILASPIETAGKACPGLS